MALAIAFLILLVAAPAAVFGADHIVGDDQGWNSGVDYETWASGKTFTVGDTLGKYIKPLYTADLMFYDHSFLVLRSL